MAGLLLCRGAAQPRGGQFRRSCPPRGDDGGRFSLPGCLTQKGRTPPPPPCRNSLHRGGLPAGGADARSSRSIAAGSRARFSSQAGERRGGGRRQPRARRAGPGPPPRPVRAAAPTTAARTWRPGVAVGRRPQRAMDGRSAGHASPSLEVRGEVGVVFSLSPPPGVVLQRVRVDVRRSSPVAAPPPSTRGSGLACPVDRLRGAHGAASPLRKNLRDIQSRQLTDESQICLRVPHGVVEDLG